MKDKILEKIRDKFEFIFKLNDLFDRKERWQFFLVLVVALAMAVFQAIGVASILPFINIVMDPSVIHNNRWLNYFFNFFNFESVSSFILATGFTVLGLLVIGNIISALSTWLKINFVWKKNHKLSSDLLKKYLSMPYVYFLNNNTASLGKNVLAEVYQLTNSLVMPLAKIVTDMMIIIVILIMLFWVNLIVTLIAIGVLAFSYLIIYFYFSDKLKLGGIERLKENVGRYKSVGEALGGIKDLKVLGTEEFFLNKFSIHSKNFSHTHAYCKIIGELPRYIMEIIAFGGIVIILIFLVISNMPSQKIIPLMSFFAFAGYRLMPALQEVFNSFTNIKFNQAVLDKIHYDMSIEGFNLKYALPKRHNIKPIYFKEKIELKNIYFSYPKNNKKALININLEIKKNNFIALIGSTGAGKTTLVDLILGLLFLQKGSFLVDGIKIDEKNIKNWQANLGYVPQQIYLSDDTIARNIAFGLPDDKIDLKQVKKVARMANIHNFIDEELPKDYHTIIGERGVRLSGGQRQRIGIARALYHDPEVLIFDEATSSLDNSTEKEVLEAIEKVAEQKTMIVIAHRLTTVKNCDKVYVINKGKIVNEGSYNEIIGKRNQSID